MALTLRGSGQVSADNYGIDSDGSITATGITSTGDVAINGVLTTTGLGTTLSSNSYNIVTIQTDKDDTAAADGLLQFTHGSASTVKGEIRYDASESMFELGHGDNQGHVRINNSGYVTTPNQPAFSAGFTTNQTRVDSTYLSTGWTEQVLFNTGTHFNTSNGTFTAPIAGKYFFGLQGSWSGTNGTNTDAWYVAMRVNDANATDTNNWFLHGPESGVEGSISHNFMFELSANDTVRVYTGGTAATITFMALQFFGYLVC
jgi:hypothetical protein